MPTWSMPGHLAGVLDVRDDVGDRRARAAAARRPGARNPGRASRSCGSRSRRGHRRPATAWSQSRRGGRHELRHERHHAHAAVGGQRGEHVVGDVAGVVGDRAAGRVREDHRAARWWRGRRAWSWPRRGRGRRASRSGSSPAPPRGRTPSSPPCAGSSVAGVGPRRCCGCASGSGSAPRGGAARAARRASRRCRARPRRPSATRPAPPRAPPPTSAAVVASCRSSG